MKIFLCFFMILSTARAADYYTMKHLDCNIRYKKTDSFLSRLAMDELADKNFNVQDFVNGDKMNVGDLYFKLDFRRDPEKMWKDCIVKVAVKKASAQKAFPKDKTLYERSVRRALPRHTFSGNERCKRALKDTFVHIPKCIPMTINEKIKGN